MKTPPWVRLLASVTGMINQELLLRNEYLVAENRILRSKVPGRLRLANSERATLAQMGKRLGRKALDQIACAAKPDTIFGWYHKLIAQKFDGCKFSKLSWQASAGSEYSGLDRSICAKLNMGL